MLPHRPLQCTSQLRGASRSSTAASCTQKVVPNVSRNIRACTAAVPSSAAQAFLAIKPLLADVSRLATPRGTETAKSKRCSKYKTSC